MQMHTDRPTGTCITPGCSRPRYPGSEYCSISHREYVLFVMHEMSLAPDAMSNIAALEELETPDRLRHKHCLVSNVALAHEIREDCFVDRLAFSRLRTALRKSSH